MQAIHAIITLLLLLGSISGVQASIASVVGSAAGGIFALIILILDIVAIYELITSTGRGTGSKVIWVLIILFFPIGGLILYWCCARNKTVDQSI